MFVVAPTSWLAGLRSLHRRGHLLSKERQIIVAQIEEDGRNAVDLTGLLLDPTGDLLTSAAGAYGTENDSNGSHDVSFQSLIETSTTINAPTVLDKEKLISLRTQVLQCPDALNPILLSDTLQPTYSCI